MLKWFRKYTKYLVKVNYKSGNSEKFWTYYFNIEIVSGASSRSSVEWKSISKRPIYLNIDEIESVWVLKTKWGRNDWTI